MKSTYKLLGSFWDGRPVLKEPLPLYTQGEMPRDYRNERDLFDSNGYVRSIEISDLLRLDDGAKVDCILESLKHCDKVVVLTNKKLSTNNPVIERYLDKRMSQSLRYMKESLNGVMLDVLK